MNFIILEETESKQQNKQIHKLWQSVINAMLGLCGKS